MKPHISDEQMSRFFDRMHTPATSSSPSSARPWRPYHVEQWPNKLGYDCGPVEVMIHKEAFGCRTDDRVLRVPYSITTDPQRAAELCYTSGLLSADLAQMEYNDAQRAYLSARSTK